ncbi:MAG: DEAD/DEAH box helicase [Thermoflexales bacterium]|nr:DEAD/DEAH box helicase [Thermoflexales bacterium]
MQTDLPIWALADALRDAWDRHNNLLLVAPTGSGKTTQVPQMLLDARPAWTGRIVVLQPRRVAARSVARRVAEERGVTVGQEVGYQVRFEDMTDLGTRLCYVTEGILLRWLRDNPALDGVDAVLFDEFHERNVLSDIALALCKRLQRERRPELLLMVMSATLEAEPVAAYLGSAARPAPVLRSEGCAFPVSVRYASWDRGDDLEAPVWERAAQRCAALLDEMPEGDVLIFMPGAYEIEQTLLALRARLRGRATPTQLMALHGEQPPREQDRVFEPSSNRRVIVATNVAETSLTLPGIRAVIDSGQARVARFDVARGISTLAVEAISRASADQRAGRAGRVSAGVCERLWREGDHAARPERNTPEIQRVELSDVVLQMAAQGVRDIEGFDFLESPDPERLHAAVALLRTLGALEGVGPREVALTAVGARMRALPVHPRYARMMIEAGRLGVGGDAALFAALMSGRDLLARLGRQETITRDKRARVIAKGGENQSDFFALRRAFHFARENGFDGRTCHAHGINPQVAREVAQTEDQLLALAREEGLLDTPRPEAMSANEALRRSHLAGFVDLLVQRTTGSSECELADGQRGEIAEDSMAGRGSAHHLFVASEVRRIHTRAGGTLTLLNTLSAVEPAWVAALDPRPDGLTEGVEHLYDRLNKRVVAARVLRFGALALGGSPVEGLDPQAAAAALAAAFLDKLDRLPPWRDVAAPWLKAHPEASHALTLMRLEAVLVEAWHGATGYADLLTRPILPALRAALEADAS